MNIYVKVLLFSFLTLVVQHVVRMIYILKGYGNDWINHYPGNCRHITGFVTDGSEDMTELSSGQVLISSGLIGFSGGTSNISSAIYLWDGTVDATKVNKLEIEGLQPGHILNGHGLDHWAHQNGSVSVFLVTHHPEAVMRFLLQGNILTLTKVYKSKLFTNINSVFVTGEDSFYVTNAAHTDYGNQMVKLELFLHLPLGSVVYMQGDLQHVVANNLMLSNGLTGNSKYLYVACKDAVNIYNILPGKDLKLFKTIKVSIGSMDNLKLDKAGDLWIGCQPYLSEIVPHLSDHSHKCPSQILRVKDPETYARVESILFDDGNFLSGTSVALFTTSRKLLVGTVHDKMAVCDVNYLS